MPTITLNTYEIGVMAKAADIKYMKPGHGMWSSMYELKKRGLVESHKGRYPSRMQLTRLGQFVFDALPRDLTNYALYIWGNYPWFPGISDVENKDQWEWSIECPQ